MADEPGARPATRDVAFALLFAIGGNTLMAPRGPVALAPVAACPGALEVVAIVVAHVAPSAPLGIWLFNVDRLLAVAAVAAFAVLATRSAGGWLAAAAAALAFASQVPFAPRLSVFGPAAILVPVLALLTLNHRGTGSNTDVRVWLGLLLTAAISPGLTLPLAVVAALYAGGAARWVTSARRSRAAAIAAAALVAWVTLLQAVMPGGPPAFTHPLWCLVPWADAWTPVHAGGELRSMLSAAGVYACSLAALGAFSFRGAVRQRRTWTLVAYVAASVAVSWIGRDAGRLIAPAMVALWVLVAAGLAEAVRACGGGFGGRVAAGLLILLLPLLQLSARAGEATSAHAGLEGQERLTLQTVAQTLRILPDDSAIVEEDATLELFLRALDGTWQRAGKRLQLLPRRAAEVAAALTAGTHVFARPAAQAELSSIGFRLTPLHDAPGFAEVREGGVCSPLDTQWHTLPGVLRSSRLALVAETDAEAGPMVAYLASDQPPVVRAVDWPPLTTRGFHVRSYDREADGDLTRIEASILDDGVPATSPGLMARYLTRLELWRTPGAPRILTVELGTTPVAAIARLGLDAAVRRLTVCPVFQLTRESIPGTIAS
jgi:hypothetical protein